MSGWKWRVTGWVADDGTWSEWWATSSDLATACCFPSWREAFAYADAMARAAA